MKTLKVTLDCAGVKKSGAILCSEVLAILPRLGGRGSLVYTALFDEGLQVEESPDALGEKWQKYLDAEDDESAMLAWVLENMGDEDED